MPKVTVTPSSTINVRVNQGRPQILKGTTTFVGATDVITRLNYLDSQSNSAFQLANQASYYANTGYLFVTGGGTVGGNVTVSQNLTVNNQEFVNGNVIITGTYLGTVDGGIFS